MSQPGVFHGYPLSSFVDSNCSSYDDSIQNSDLYGTLNDFYMPPDEMEHLRESILHMQNDNCTSTTLNDLSQEYHQQMSSTPKATRKRKNAAKPTTNANSQRQKKKTSNSSLLAIDSNNNTTTPAKRQRKVKAAVMHGTNDTMYINSTHHEVPPALKLPVSHVGRHDHNHTRWHQNTIVDIDNNIINHYNGQPNNDDVKELSLQNELTKWSERNQTFGLLSPASFVQNYSSVGNYQPSLSSLSSSSSSSYSRFHGLGYTSQPQQQQVQNQQDFNLLLQRQHLMQYSTYQQQFQSQQLQLQQLQLQQQVQCQQQQSLLQAAAVLLSMSLSSNHVQNMSMNDDDSQSETTKLNNDVVTLSNFNPILALLTPSSSQHSSSLLFTQPSSLSIMTNSSQVELDVGVAKHSSSVKERKKRKVKVSSSSKPSSSSSSSSVHDRLVSKHIIQSCNGSDVIANANRDDNNVDVEDVMSSHSARLQSHEVIDEFEHDETENTENRKSDYSPKSINNTNRKRTTACFGKLHRTTTSSSMSFNIPGLITIKFNDDINSVILLSMISQTCPLAFWGAKVVLRTRSKSRESQIHDICKAVHARAQSMDDGHDDHESYSMSDGKIMQQQSSCLSTSTFSCGGGGVKQYQADIEVSFHQESSVKSIKNYNAIIYLIRRAKLVNDMLTMITTEKHESGMSNELANDVLLLNVPESASGKLTGGRGHIVYITPAGLIMAKMMKNVHSLFHGGMDDPCHYMIFQNPNPRGEKKDKWDIYVATSSSVHSRSVSCSGLHTQAAVANPTNFKVLTSFITMILNE